MDVMFNYCSQTVIERLRGNSQLASNAKTWKKNSKPQKPNR